MTAQSFLLVVLGIMSIVVGLALVLALLRLARVLAATEEVLITANEELRETLPEVRGSLGNVNAITAGVNVGLRTAGSGATRLGEQVEDVAQDASVSARAGWYGVRVGVRTLFGGKADGK
jgi:hypothetical protein